MFLGALLRLLVERLPEHSPTQQQRNSQDPGWILGAVVGMVRLARSTLNLPWAAEKQIPRLT